MKKLMIQMTQYHFKVLLPINFWEGEGEVHFCFNLLKVKKIAFHTAVIINTVYVDDIIVFEIEHYFHVLKVLNISKYGIILSKKKANLFKTKINFLGLEIDQGTHCPKKHILEHLHNFPDALEDKKQLQRF